MSTENREVAYLKDKPLSEDYAYVYGELEDGSIVKVSKETLKENIGSSIECEDAVSVPHGSTTVEVCRITVPAGKWFLICSSVFKLVKNQGCRLMKTNLTNGVRQAYCPNAWNVMNESSFHNITEDTDLILYAQHDAGETIDVYGKMTAIRII